MLRLFSIFLFLLTTVSLHAQDFISLSASDYPVRTELPRFTTLVSGTTEAKIEYPELQLLTREEQRLLKKAGIRLDSLPTVQTTVSYARKVPQLEISLCPFVRRSGNYYRIASILITPVKQSTRFRALSAVTLALTAANSSRYAASSVLSSGKWVKIRVASEGIYQLTASQLQSMGFSDINRVKLYGYGGRMLPEALTFSGNDALIDDLQEVPLCRKEGRVLFFAEGTSRWTWSSSRWTHLNNPYSSYSYYFLTEGDNPAVLSEVATASATATTDVITHHTVLDNDTYSWYQGGRDFYDSYDFSSGNTRSFTLAAPGIVEGTTTTVRIAFAAASTAGATSVSVLLNDTTLGTMTIPAYGEYENARAVTTQYTSLKATENNTFRFNVTANRSARLDYIELTYRRRLDATSSGYSFSPRTTAVTDFVITNAGSDTQVWRIGIAGDPLSRVPASLSGTTLTATIADGSRRYVIVNTDAHFPSPTAVGTIANQNLHADSAYQMVIITPVSGLLDAQAERLAETHRTDGLNVKVVRADLLYNEFSSGTPDATAYRRYLKMLYDRAATDAAAPRYLLLFGDCLWDNRQVTTEGKKYTADNFLLSWENTSSAAANLSIGSLASYVSDDYFGLLDDGEGSNITKEGVDLSIGRFPCHDVATAKILVDKTLAYKANQQTGNWKNRLVFIADEGDNNLHMTDTENVISMLRVQSEGSKFHIKKIYPDAYTRTVTATGNSYPEVTTLLQEEMAKGALLFAYTGHGSPERLSKSYLLNKNHFADNRTEHLPLWIFASCEITPYDQQEDDIGRAALTNTGGGAVSVMCAARAVYAGYNLQLNRAFCRYLIGYDSNGQRYTMGDALRLAKNYVVGESTDLSVNKLKYALLGDPALVLAMPTGGIVLDSINGQAVTSSDNIELPAGSVARFSGHIDGNTSYNGTVTATIQDREETITCKNNDGTADSPMQYIDRPSTIYEGSDSVSNGRFSLNAIIPRSISYSTDKARLLLYAANEESTLENHGATTNFHLNGTAATEIDTIAPKVFVYLNSPDFPDGGVVGTSAVFGATLSDNYGIDASGSGVGHSMELILDGDNAGSTVLNDYFSYDFGSYSSGSVTYQLSNLTAGRHKLAFRAWDVNGNSTTATLNFVVSETVSQTLDINASTSTAVTGLHFITQNIVGDGTLVIEVFDAAGRRIWTRSKAVSGTTFDTTYWNLCTNAGARVNAGVYVYRATFNGTETDGKKIVVIKQ